MRVCKAPLAVAAGGTDTESKPQMELQKIYSKRTLQQAHKLFLTERERVMGSSALIIEHQGFTDLLRGLEMEAPALRQGSQSGQCPGEDAGLTRLLPPPIPGS